MITQQNQHHVCRAQRAHCQLCSQNLSEKPVCLMQFRCVVLDSLEGHTPMLVSVKIDVISNTAIEEILIRLLYGNS